jgi:hypothetical protein
LFLEPDMHSRYWISGHSGVFWQIYLDVVQLLVDVYVDLVLVSI